MSKCPHCKKEIDVLLCKVNYTETGNITYVFNPKTVNQYERVNKDTDEVTEDDETNTYECPECAYVIAENEIDAEEFLKKK